jgi:hypothetical protein
VSYLSALTLGVGSESDTDAPPKQQRRKNRFNPQINFEFDADLDFPTLPVQFPRAPRPQTAAKSPGQSAKSASSSITMNELHIVRTELQVQFDTDLKQFKKDITARLESEIASAAKSSIATALAGINDTINTLLQANNTLVYENMRAERDVITEATATTVSLKVDAVVTAAVGRALQNLAKPALYTRKRHGAPLNTDIIDETEYDTAEETGG